MTTLMTKHVGDVLVIGFGIGNLLDESVIQPVGQELLKQVTETESKKILLTFREVHFMSSAMLGKLVMILKTCKKHNVELKVCSISPEIFDVFKITSLNKMFDVHKDEEKAMKSFNKKGWFG